MFDLKRKRFEMCPFWVLGVFFQSIMSESVEITFPFFPLPQNKDEQPAEDETEKPVEPKATEVKINSCSLALKTTFHFYTVRCEEL